MTASARGWRACSAAKLAGLLGEVKQNGVAVEHEHAVVVDRRHLAVRVHFQKFRLELIALAGVDRHQLVRQAGLFQEQRDLVRVWRSVEVEFQHWEVSPVFVAEKSGRGFAAADGDSMPKFRRKAQATNS